MDWKIRPSSADDFAPVWAIVLQAKQRMAAMGIDQWQTGDPDEKAIMEAVLGGEGYVIEAGNGAVAGFAVISFQIEESYHNLTSGKWENDGTYAALHRVAVGSEFTGRGVAGALFTRAAEIAKDREAQSLRIDTHAHNRPMRRAVEKSGFTHCGTCVLASGEDRVVYEKRVGV